MTQPDGPSLPDGCQVRPLHRASPAHSRRSKTDLAARRRRPYRRKRHPGRIPRQHEYNDTTPSPTVSSKHPPVYWLKDQVTATTSSSRQGSVAAVFHDDGAVAATAPKRWASNATAVSTAPPERPSSFPPPHPLVDVYGAPSLGLDPWLFDQFEFPFTVVYPQSSTPAT